MMQAPAWTVDELESIYTVLYPYMYHVIMHMCMSMKISWGNGYCSYEVNRLHSVATVATRLELLTV